MPNTAFMPNDDHGKAELLEHLVITLPKYIELLNISGEMMDSLRADSLAFRHSLNNMDAAQSYAMHCTALKNLQRDGGSGNTDWPIPPLLDENPPPTVAPGIVKRLYALGAYIKAQKNYTAAIGQELWLIGYKQVLDPGSWKPALSSQLKAGHPVIIWTKGKASALEIWVDRGDGNGFVFLTISTTPNTTDRTPGPPPASSALWQYKAIYRLHDEQVGHWSDVINVTVEG